jgi:hypothetical protein
MPQDAKEAIGHGVALCPLHLGRDDDIDAPDLKALPPAPAGAKPAPNRHGRLNGSQGHQVYEREEC